MISFDVRCNLCGQSNFTVLEEDQPPFRVLKCNNCSLIFVYPHPDHSELIGHYNKNYYVDWIGTQKDKRIRMWEERLHKLKRFRSGGWLLDVGCGEGLFLHLAKENGWQISGTELSSYAAGYASNSLKVDIFCGEILDAGFPRDFFDVVTMWHVLEHVKDPKAYLREVRHILKHEGLLVIAVPNVNAMIMQIAYRIAKRRRLKLFSKEEKEVHLYHFAVDTIRAYLEKTGFECLRLSPDFGIIEGSKKLINMISVIPYFIAGIKIFNSIEVYARLKKE
jgi:2-polyprenyl-3-methyl-5-hydroxy-6-metoxy-1,4-benzoquinol methylase